MEEELNQIWTWLQTNGINVLLIAIGAVVVYFIWEWVIRLIVRRIQALDDVDNSELDKRSETIGNVLHSAGIVVVLVTAVLMILPEFNINIAPVLASVGVVSLALGLGAQTMVKDVISGMFILFENQYTVGDVVEIQGVTGTVEEVTLRVTVIRDLTGTLHTIPMGEIRQVANKSRDWSRAIVDVSITYDEDVDEAVAALNMIATELQNDAEYGPTLQEDPVVTGVEGLEDWAVRCVSLRIMVAQQQNQRGGTMGCTALAAPSNSPRFCPTIVHFSLNDRTCFAIPRQDVGMIVNSTETQID